MSNTMRFPPARDPLASVEDKELARAVWDLFRRADEHVARMVSTGVEVVVVLVSRRLSCLYEMITADAGVALFEGANVISDRALEGNSGDLTGRSVLLLDDSLVLGSTLVDLFDEVVGMTRDANLVKTMVACIDAQRRNIDLVEHLGLARNGTIEPDIVVKDTKALERFAFDVASALYRSGTPYFMDFPLLKPLDVQREQVYEFLRSPRWLVADVTPPGSFVDEGQEAYSLVPTAEVAHEIRRRGMPEAMAFAELLKVRLYLRPNAAGTENDCILRVVPIGVPGPMSVDRLDAILAAMESFIPGITLKCKTWDPPAKHRLVQMYLSSCVVAEWWSEASGLLPIGELVGELLDRSHLHNYFGGQDAALVSEAFTVAVRRYAEDKPSERIPVVAPIAVDSGLGVDVKVRTRIVKNAEFVVGTCVLGDRLQLLHDAVPPRRPQPDGISTVDHFWAHRILLVFGFIDDELERPQEEQLSSYSYKEYRRYRRNDGDERVGPRVLKKGITLCEIRDLFMPEADLGDEWERATASFAVDIGNDLGVIVPTTRFDRRLGIVSRQYRSGETAFVANSPHERVARVGSEEAESVLDLYTRSVIADRAADSSFEAVLRRFSEETAEIAAEALPMDEVLQIWMGEVLELVNGHVRADVVSCLNDVDNDIALLPRELFGPDADVEVGSQFRWVVFDGRSPSGHPRPVPQVRLLRT